MTRVNVKTAEISPSVVASKPSRYLIESDVELCLDRAVELNVIAPSMLDFVSACGPFS